RLHSDLQLPSVHTRRARRILMSSPGVVPAGVQWLERCGPGGPLSTVDPDEALRVYSSLLPQLWIMAGAPFTSLAEEAAQWIADLPIIWEKAGRPTDVRLLDLGLESLERLRTTQGPQVLVHQDLHAGNILRAKREPWLVIDPKPLAGEREFSLAPIVRGAELG